MGADCPNKEGAAGEGGPKSEDVVLVDDPNGATEPDSPPVVGAGAGGPKSEEVVLLDDPNVAAKPNSSPEVGAGAGAAPPRPKFEARSGWACVGCAKPAPDALGGFVHTNRGAVSSEGDKTVCPMVDGASWSRLSSKEARNSFNPVPSELSSFARVIADKALQYSQGICPK